MISKHEVFSQLCGAHVRHDCPLGIVSQSLSAPSVILTSHHVLPCLDEEINRLNLATRQPQDLAREAEVGANWRRIEPVYESPECLRWCVVHNGLTFGSCLCAHESPGVEMLREPSRSLGSVSVGDDRGCNRFVGLGPLKRDSEPLGFAPAANLS